MFLDVIFALVLAPVALAVARGAGLVFHQKAYFDPKRKIVTGFQLLFFLKPKTNAPVPVVCVGSLAKKP
ncbi:MAG TPA: hypothetical protein VMU69_23250 [Bradyrhizobium sp.]|nr:hypothetical protein [Bradyrhizobium sp.]